MEQMASTCRLISNRTRRESVPDDILMLDFDGTLAPHTPARNTPRPYPGVLQALQSIVDHRAAKIVFVTGRRAEELARIMEFRGWTEIWGEHGLERLKPDGTLDLMEEIEAGECIEDFMHRLTAAGLAMQAERKRAGIAMHWRGFPLDLAQDIRRRTLAVCIEILQRPDVHLLKFDHGWEFRFSARTKGDVVREVLWRAHPGARIAYLGDDITDESAFEAMAGRGETVLVRPSRRSTLARTWLRPPDELITYLQNWCNNAEEGRRGHERISQ